MNLVRSDSDQRLRNEAREDWFRSSNNALSLAAPTAQEQSEPDFLAQLWKTVWAHKGLVSLIALLGCAAGLALSFLQTPIYRAKGAVEIQGVNNDFLNARSINPVSETSGIDASIDAQTQRRVLESDDLIERVLQKLKATGKIAPLEKECRQWPWQAPMNRAQLEDAMRMKASGSLVVRNATQTKVLEVLYSSEDPVFAADFVNTLISQYILSNLEARAESGSEISKYLLKELEASRVKLQTSENALQDYALRSGLLFAAPITGSPDKTNVSEEKLRQLQESLSRAQAELAAAQSHFETAKNAAPDTLADVLNDPSLQNLQARLTELRSRRGELETIYTADDPKLERIDAQIAPLQSAFNAKRNAILESIRHTYETAQRRQQLLAADFGGQAKIVGDEAHKAIPYNILKREVDSNTQIYNSMLEEVKRATISSAVQASNVRVVDQARVPVLPASPQAKLNAAIGLFLGLVGGSALIYIRDRANSKLKLPGDTQLWTRVPELGVIPNVNLKKSRLPHSENGNVSSSRLIAAPAGIDEKAGIKLGFAHQLRQEPREGMLGEAFRTVITSLLGRSSDRAHRLLMFTSGNPSEGKTTVVSNLALAMAQVRRRVLIIDADLRHPQIHDIFGLDNSVGLSTLIMEGANSASRDRVFVRSTSVPGLDVLTSGPAIPDPAYLLFAPELAERLSHFAKEYDVVLIDTPPSLHFADARIIGRHCDGAVIVVRAGQTTREEAIAVQQRLMEDRTPLLGTIFNHWDPKKGLPRSYYATSFAGVRPVSAR